MEKPEEKREEDAGQKGRATYCGPGDVWLRKVNRVARRFDGVSTFDHNFDDDRIGREKSCFDFFDAMKMMNAHTVCGEHKPDDLVKEID